MSINAQSIKNAKIVQKEAIAKLVKAAYAGDEPETERQLDALVRVAKYQQEY